MQSRDGAKITLKLREDPPVIGLRRRLAAECLKRTVSTGRDLIPQAGFEGGAFLLQRLFVAEEIDMPDTRHLS